MRNLFVIISCFLLSFNAQAIAETAENEQKISSILEDKKAQFPGGKEKMDAWIAENLLYPKKELRHGIVRVEFTVKKNGKCTDFTIVKGLNETMDYAAIDCLMGMPPWEAAEINGKKVNSTVVLPIKFAVKEE